MASDQFHPPGTPQRPPMPDHNSFIKKAAEAAPRDRRADYIGQIFQTTLGARNLHEGAIGAPPGVTKMLPLTMNRFFTWWLGPIQTELPSPRLLWVLAFAGTTILFVR
jgi:hypothetical protein